LNDKYLNFLETSQLASVATVTPKGQPVVVPMVFIYMDKNFFLITNKNTKKIKNIQKNNKISLAIYSEIGKDHKVVLVSGNAEILSENQNVDKIKNLFLEKYPFLPMIHSLNLNSEDIVIIKITPINIKAWG